MTGWFPGTPSWMRALLFMTALCGTNLAAVRNFGELEFWFAAPQFGAIPLFLVVGGLAIFGGLPGTNAPGAANLAEEGGFLPHGMNGLVVGLIVDLVVDLLISVFVYGGPALVLSPLGYLRRRTLTARR
jgi:GABA permease